MVENGELKVKNRVISPSFQCERNYNRDPRHEGLQWNDGGLRNVVVKGLTGRVNGRPYETSCARMRRSKKKILFVGVFEGNEW